MGFRDALVRRTAPAADPHVHGDQGAASAAHDDEHASHNHVGHTEVNSLELSQQARKNIGLRVAKVELQPFQRMIEIPGIIIESPGRSIVEITAPFTGVVTRIDAILGEAVQPGQKLFDVRLTHEDLVQAQTEFLRTAEELAVIDQEVKRLEVIAAGGAIAGKTLLERTYEQQKQAAHLRAQRQALLLHGLSEAQVEGILETRTLLKNLTIAVPEENVGAFDGDATPLYQVQELKVEKGQQITAGDTLAVLANHAALLIEGSAFEKDMDALNTASASGWRVSAIVESDGAEPDAVRDLSILYLSGKVDSHSRAFHFYVTLPNTLLREDRSMSGQRFIYWRYKPGQRVRLQVPVERWPDRIVLPADAVARDGVETYVFQANGDRFDRRAVHVEYRDHFSVVVANDGSIFPGDVVAVFGAQQLQLALKNKSGGAIDPHAGHSH